MFKYKLKVIDARKAWMKSPEVLENCSTGFYFPCQSGEITQVCFSLLQETFLIEILLVINSLLLLDHRKR